MSNFVRIYIVPGAVFQSVIVGGGYGTGREVVEFISRFGPLGGLLAIGLVAILMALVLTITFEIARRFSLYDYRSFLKLLLGRLWIAYELTFLVSLVLVLAVTGSAAGSVLNDAFGLPLGIGIAAMLGIVVGLNYSGRSWVEKTLTGWGLLLSGVLISFVVATLLLRGEAIALSFSQASWGAVETKGWFISGFKFFLYNVFLAPVVLYAVGHIETQRQSIVAGLIAALLAVLPGFVFHIAFMAGYPGILSQSLPTYWLLRQLALPALMLIYVVVLFGTIAQTGVGVLQGINERLDAWWLERKGRTLGPRVHAALAGCAVMLSLLLARLGIVDLVAKGYGSLAWVSLFVYVLPVLTLGVIRLRGRVALQNAA